MKLWLKEEAPIYKIRNRSFGGKTDNKCGGFLVPIRFFSDESWAEYLLLADLTFSRVFGHHKPIIPERVIEETMRKPKGGGQIDLFDEGDLPKPILQW